MIDWTQPYDGIAPEQLFAFLEITPLDRHDAREMWDRVIGPQIDETLSRFYEQLRQFEVNALIAPSRLEPLKASQKEHWRRLFTSEFDGEYANGIRRVGIRHKELGIDPGWYVASYSRIRIELFSLALSSESTMTEKRRMIRLIEKYVAFDMALALSTYDVTVID